MKNNKIAIIYCRVSSIKQLNDGDSLNNQEKACRLFAKNKNIKVIGVFKEAFTGKKSDRPVFNEAILNGRENKVDYFLVFDIDRFSREGYGVYSDLKNQLKNDGIELKDSKNVIGDSNLVIQNDIVDMSQYEWNVENQSEMAEMVYSAQAKIEGNKIPQRTINRELELEQAGFHVRDSNIGYMLKKVNYDNKGKGKIQIKHPLEGEWLIEIFEERAKGLLSDEHITKNINIKGGITRRGNKFTTKYMQSLIKNTKYAGVIIGKWTGNKAIKAQYKGLVNVELWNQANKGKRTIIENEDGTVNFIEGNKDQGENNIQKRRKKFDKNLPFRNLIESSDIPGKFISGSFSNPKRNKSTGYYHPIRIKGKKGENIKKELFEKQVTSLFDSIKINTTLRIIFEDRFNKIFEQNKEKVNKNMNIYQEQLKDVTSEIKGIENRIENIDMDLIESLKIFEKKIQKLKRKKENISQKIESYKNTEYKNPEDFKKFCFYIIEHLSDLLSQSKSHEELSTLFKFVFKKTPTYNEINNRTFQIHPVFSLQSKKELSKIESSSLNRKWQAH